MTHFKGKQFKKDIIIVSNDYYLRYNLSDSWRMDETYIKVKGKRHYLYFAVDSFGLTLDIWLRKNRNKQVSYAFFKWLVKQFGEPRVLVTDKAPSLSSVFNRLKSEEKFSYTIHRISKYLNNMIEQDYHFSP